MSKASHSVVLGVFILGSVGVGCSDADQADESAAVEGADNASVPLDGPMVVTPEMPDAVPDSVGAGSGQPAGDDEAPTPATPVIPAEEPEPEPMTEPPSDAVTPALPVMDGSCPVLTNDTVEVAGSEVRLWVGSTPGPVYFYFHGTGSSPTEVNQGLPGATEAVVTEGGLVASFAASNGRGTNTGNGVWYTGDFEAADQILGCAMQEGLVDARRIHAAGYSAGGLQTGAMVFARSNYLASAIVYSGGKGLGAGALQDPSNVPPTLFAHGAVGSDVVILDFAQRSMAMSAELLELGGFALDCNDGGGHIAPSRLGVQGAALEFLAAHPFGTSPSPYASALPSTFPDFCEVVR